MQFYGEILSNAVDLRIYTWFVFKHIKNTTWTQALKTFYRGTLIAYSILRPFLIIFLNAQLHKSHFHSVGVFAII